MLQLAIMNHRLFMLDDEVQARQRRGSNDSGSGHGYPQTEGLNLDTTTNYLLLRMEDNSSFSNYMRMEPLVFDEILDRVSPWIQKSDTHFRKALEPGLELERIMR